MATNGIASRPGAISQGSTSRASIDLTGIPAELRPLIEEQMKMNEEQQLVTRLTNLMKHKHDLSMAIINNMK